VIYTLLLTLLVEGAVVFVYCAVQKRPAGVLLQASFIVNMFTQSMLWIVLRFFFRHYLIALITAEVLIWLVESAFMYKLPGNKLSLSHAAFLSLCMNLSSFGVGWFLPV